MADTLHATVDSVVESVAISRQWGIHTWNTEAGYFLLLRLIITAGFNCTGLIQPLCETQGR